MRVVNEHRESVERLASDVASLQQRAGIRGRVDCDDLSHGRPGETREARQALRDAYFSVQDVDLRRELIRKQRLLDRLARDQSEAEQAERRRRRTSLLKQGASVRPAFLIVTIVACVAIASWWNYYGPIGPLLAGAFGGVTYGYVRESGRRQCGRTAALLGERIDQFDLDRRRWDLVPKECFDASEEESGVPAGAMPSARRRESLASC